ncbi:MAG: hypothetical protein RJA70_2620 [Pseudomonadota bacterium]|jgi:molybdopterin molybdotransferase
MLSLDEALQRVLANVRPLGSEFAPISQALRRTLDGPVIARVALPYFDNSAMDGYAVSTRDFYGNGPWNLPVVCESRAGSVPPALASDTCMRIFTGAPIPFGADAVVLQEDVTRSGSSAQFKEAPRPLDHIRRQGEDIAVGDVALPGGTRLSPFHLGLLASLEVDKVAVCQRPRVHILCTGDELRRPPMLRAPGTIPESNGIAIGGLVEQAGGLATLGPLVPDNQEQARVYLREALQNADIVVSIGGVSVGEHDVMRDAMLAEGVNLDFWKVAIKPGKPLVFGRYERPGRAHRSQVTVLGLPGNPVSAQLTCCLFALPLIRALQGDTNPCAPIRYGTLTAPIRQKPGRRGFYRVRVQGEAVTPLAHQGSGSTSSLAWADALAIVHEDSDGIDLGGRVPLLLLSEL